MEYKNIKSLAKNKFYLDKIAENYKYSNFAISVIFRDSCTTDEKRLYNIVLAMLENKTYMHDIGKVLRYIYGLPLFRNGIMGNLRMLIDNPCYTTNLYKIIVQDIVEVVYGTKKTDFYKYGFLLDVNDKENVVLKENDLSTELEITVPSHDIPRPTDEVKNIIKTSGWMGLYYIIKLLYNMPVKR